ncbi:MAG: hypothetical protein ACFCVD_16875 [Nodosilinea sp.]
MHDNKVRLSQDVLEKAERIAAEWGLKNSRAAVEAVFRRYCDDYLYGRPSAMGGGSPPGVRDAAITSPGDLTQGQARIGQVTQSSRGNQCEALDALDQLLAL